MKKNITIHKTKTHPCRIEFYVRTDKGINRGTVMLDGSGLHNYFVKNNWMSKPYLTFTYVKRKGLYHINMKGGNDKEAMHIFTIHDHEGNYEIKTN